MSASHGSTISCQHLEVARKVCYLRFGNAPVANSGEIGLTTRGEMMIADYNADGHIIGIELVGAGRPCQE